METRIKDRMWPTIPNYNFEYVPMPLSAGGVERMKTTMYDTKSLKKPLMSLFRHFGLKLNSLRKAILFVELSTDNIILQTAS